MAALRLLLAMLWFAAGSALAGESILNYDTDIELRADGSMVVTETITVRAEGRDIRRGIYRDFPTRYSDRWGNQVLVDFELLSAKRDGQTEGYRQERRRNGVRIYLGRSNYLLPPGQYTYEIRYRTNHQVGFFDEFDELYWNATGNDWLFPIEQASAHIRLPVSVARDQLELAGYSGYYGKSDPGVSFEVGASGVIHFVSKSPLAPAKGMTILAAFPKGIVAQPTRAQKFRRLLENNSGLLAGLLGLLMVIGYYLSAWQRLGRDPSAGLVIPRYEPPKGYSPAALRYIWRRKYDTGCFSAGLISLAVKGELSIRQTKKLMSRKFSVKRTTPENPSKLAAGEFALLDRLLGGRVSRLYFESKNHARIAGAIKDHERSLQKDYGKQYFVLNRGTFSIGMIASGLTAAVMLVMSHSLSAPMVLIGIALLLTNFAFYRWLEAPTMHGRSLLDHLEGFRLYLGVAERPDLERHREPLPTFEEFEKQLPYAVALDCANTWVDRFESELSRLEQAGQLPQRGWLSSNGNISVRNIADSVNSMGSSLGGAISSSSTPPRELPMEFTLLVIFVTETWPLLDSQPRWGN